MDQTITVTFSVYILDMYGRDGVGWERRCGAVIVQAPSRTRKMGRSIPEI